MDGLEPGKLMTEREVAEYLGVHIRTVQYWRNRKTGPRSVKMGRLVRYLSDDLSEWLVARETKGKEKK